MEPDNQNNASVAASGMGDGLVTARQNTTDESGKLCLIAKDTEPKEPRNSHEQDASRENEYLLKLVASLETCNMALLNKLNQAERELAALKQPPAQIIPETKSTANPEQSFGWERKLTRTQWRSS